MPHLKIVTNVSREKIPADLVKTLCQVISTSVGKPLKFVCVTIVPDVIQSWGGTDEPSAQAILMSHGGLGIEENRRHSKAIFDVVTEGLGIEPTRMYIHFQDVKGQDIGYNGTTMAPQ